MTSPVKIIVIDDHPLFRAGVVSAIELDSQLKVVAEGSSSKEAIELVKSHRPDIVLLDISLPDGSGIKAAAALAACLPRPQILMLTVSNDVEDLRGAIENGASGYVLKGVNATDLIQAIRVVASGRPFISPTLSFELLSSMGRPKKPDRLASLTPKERAILELVATGMSNRDISDRLEINEKTVKYHIYNAFKKLSVRNRVQASQVLAETEKPR